MRVIYKGLSLVELMVVILLLGVVATISVPLFRRPGVPEHEQFQKELNALVRTGVNQAKMSGVMQAIMFDFQKNSMSLMRVSSQKNSLGDLQFEPVRVSYMKTTIPLPANLSFTRFSIKGKDEFAGGGTLLTMYFLIMPSGTTQEVSLALQDRAGRQYAFMLNPFTAIFASVHETS